MYSFYYERISGVLQGLVIGMFFCNMLATPKDVFCVIQVSFRTVMIANLIVEYKQWMIVSYCRKMGVLSLSSNFLRIYSPNEFIMINKEITWKQQVVLTTFSHSNFVVSIDLAVAQGAPK